MSEENTLARKLEILFPDTASRNDAVSILDEYGSENHEREVIRVRLAIIKLSNNSLDKIIEFTDAAKKDYRDILSWAEYPRQSKYRLLKDNDKKQKLNKENLEE